MDNYVYRLKYGRADTVAMAIMALYSGNPMALMALSQMNNSMMGSMMGNMAPGVGGMWHGRLRRWLWRWLRRLGGYGGGGYGGMGGTAAGGTAAADTAAGRLWRAMAAAGAWADTRAQ